MTVKKVWNARDRATSEARKEIIRRLKRDDNVRDIAEAIGYSTARVYQIKSEMKRAKP